jgi:hypothetical protein
MSLLTDILCTGADLLRLKFQVEAKYLSAKLDDGAKSIQSFVKQLCFLWGMLAFCIVLLAGGVGFMMWGAYALLASTINPGWAALLVGLIVSLVAITVLGAVKNSIK